MFEYPVDLERDGEFWMATIPGFPPGTQGDTRDDALKHAEQFVEDAIGGYMRAGIDLPSIEPAAGRPTVALSPLNAAKAGLYVAMREAGVTKAELARRLGWADAQVQRLFDLRHRSRLENLALALSAIGRKLVVGIEYEATR